MPSSPLPTIRIACPGGVSATVLPLGATLVSLEVPVGSSRRNVVLGYENPDDYLSDPYYMGASIGRFAGRISNGVLTIGGERHQVKINEVSNGHSLHGGSSGWSAKNWQVSSVGEKHVRFAYLSADGEQGFPGEVSATVEYSIPSPNQIDITFRATTRAATVVNMTNHAYFNLGTASQPIGDHFLQVYGDQYLPIKASLAPTGDFASVTGTPFDFTQRKRISDSIQALSSSGVTGGLDHSFVLAHRSDPRRQLAAVLESPSGDLRMLLHTTQPTLHVYSSGTLGEPFARYGAICLEAQGYSDAPNQSNFPSAEIHPGEVYCHTTSLSFNDMHTRTTQ
ncbi:galactose mutarotase [Pseudohalioglobus sediminis]|uniref:Aldose 1-epimerase n=1 Tax=Pseudohalioglobus sediminis TaxID=2606449 RepID=A0A5B0WQ85_9GAMM|nr:aldose epimerase family protein [Pseudohalioglobus sediminis]KAA1188415.1 galactose mutarotase [Pseudohalioglobus sediminis]